jgi:hypothetical protein
MDDILLETLAARNNHKFVRRLGISCNYAQVWIMNLLVQECKHKYNDMKTVEEDLATSMNMRQLMSGFIARSHAFQAQSVPSSRLLEVVMQNGDVSMCVSGG